MHPITIYSRFLIANLTVTLNMSVHHVFCWGKEKQALASMLSSSQLQSSFINSLDSGVSSKHVKGSRQHFWGPDTLSCCIVFHSPPKVGSQENGLLQDNMVAGLGQSQGADREYEDGEEDYLVLFHIETTVWHSPQACSRLLLSSGIAFDVLVHFFPEGSPPCLSNGALQPQYSVGHQNSEDQ